MTMRARNAFRRAGRLGSVGVVVWVAAVAGWSGSAQAGPPPRAQAWGRSEGADLFLREWSVADPASPGGDGLGPVFNERSCFACHRLGGAGGAGPNEKNVSILSVLGPADLDVEQSDSLAKWHSGLRNARSVVLHRFGPDPEYEAWRLDHARSQPTIVTASGSVSVQLVERNTPPIFGLGRIDAISEYVIEQEAMQPHPRFPEIKGRTSHLADGRLGRFGWKAQIATLEDFVLSACAGELGLAAPGHPQPPDPRKADERAPPPGLDLSPKKALALVDYVRGLREPIVARPRSLENFQSASLGKAIFSMIGCAECHTPRMGPVDGIYSDLLLHEMGRDDSEAGMYYGDPSVSSGRLAGPQEWRTPPLWGLAVSGPYMHDGRALTIEQAIRKHGGEAAETVKRFTRLSRAHQRALWDFLSLLAAPPVGQTGPVVVGMHASHVPSEPLFVPDQQWKDMFPGFTSIMKTP
jgi:CxxC motif-containing protein (DUF1111 family)